MSSHLPPCRSSDVSSEHIHTFQVAQKLPQCPSPHGPGACCRPRRYWRSGRSGAAARSGEPRGLAEALLSIRAVSLLLSEGQAREGKARLAASGPQGCDQASAAPALPAGPKRRASSQRGCGSAGARARPGHLRPRHLVQGRQAQGRPPASILYLPSCPSPPLQPSPVAPLRAPRGPAAPGYALAPSAPSGMAAWPGSPGSSAAWLPAPVASRSC